MHDASCTAHVACYHLYVSGYPSIDCKSGCFKLQDGLQPQQSLGESWQQRSGQLSQQLPGHSAHHISGQLQQQSEALDPSWTQTLGSTALPQEARHDNSTAAYQALLSEEAQRMLRRASQDSTHFNARSLLRTPQHLLPLVEACKTLRGLQTLDLSLNALSDSALTQLQDLANSGVQLTSLDLSHNQFSSQAAARICRIVSHISHVGLSQPHPSSVMLPRLASTSGSGAQDSPASGSRNLDAAAQAADNQNSGVLEPAASAAASAAAGEADAAAPSSAAAQQGLTAASQQHFGGSHSRLARAAFTSGSGVIATGWLYSFLTIMIMIMIMMIMMMMMMIIITITLLFSS